MSEKLLCFDIILLFSKCALNWHL